jgi:tetratricopeptide (TPR) repeat protein
VPAATAATAPRPPEPSEGRRWLDRGIALFEQGKFAEAVRLLQESPEIAADGVEVRAQSLKYQAFGQCVTGRQAACRRSFDALLALDPSFERAKAAAGAGAVGRRASR